VLALFLDVAGFYDYNTTITFSGVHIWNMGIDSVQQLYIPHPSPHIRDKDAEKSQKVFYKKELSFTGIGIFS